jgi:hypothetical protein
VTSDAEERILDELLAIRAVLARLEALMEKIALGMGVRP